MSLFEIKTGYICICIYVYIYIYIYIYKWLNGDSTKFLGTISVLVIRRNRPRNFVARHSTTWHGWYPKNILLYKIGIFQIQFTNLIYWGSFFDKELIYEMWVQLRVKNEVYWRHTIRIKFSGRNISTNLKHYTQQIYIQRFRKTNLGDDSQWNGAHAVSRAHPPIIG